MPKVTPIYLSQSSFSLSCSLQWAWKKSNVFINKENLMISLSTTKNIISGKSLNDKCNKLVNK